MEKILEETTGIGEHLGGEVETLCKENSMESTRVTLAKIPSNGDMESELVISCN